MKLFQTFTKQSQKINRDIYELAKKEYLEDAKQFKFLQKGQYEQYKQLTPQYDEKMKQFKIEKQQIQEKLRLSQKEDYKQKLKEVYDFDIDSVQKQEEFDRNQQKLEKEKKMKEKEKEKKTIVPQKIEIRNLKSKQNSNKLILIGIQRNNAIHAQYLYDAMLSLKPNIISTQISCDQPLFIRTEQNYQDTWKNFIFQNNQQPFLINPNPQRLQDIILNSDKLKWFMTNNIGLNPQFDVSPIYIEESVDIEGETINLIDNMKSPFLFGDNFGTPVIAAGAPELIIRETIARNNSEKELYNILSLKKKSISDGTQLKFDPLLLKPNIFIRPKLKYEVEILKQMQRTFKRSLAIVEYSSVNLIEEQWIQFGEEKLCQDFTQLYDEKKPIENFDLYLKKLAILDILLGPFIYDNFIKYETFPYEYDFGFKLSMMQQWDSIIFKLKSNQYEFYQIFS